MIKNIFAIVIFGIILTYCLGLPAIVFPKPRLDGRIVGGYKVDIHDIPYQISLQSSSRHICGGSIINEKWILTAGHCTSGAKPENIKIRIGSSSHNYGGILLNVKNITIHHKFSYSTIDYDFSLLELESPIVYDANKNFIALPEQDEDIADNTNCVVSGWGNTMNAMENDQYLRAAIVPIFNQNKCKEHYESVGGVTDRMICAGLETGGKDACQGDSGGPLVADAKLIGVVSWGYGCARPDFPGIYSRVASVRHWITQISGV